LRHACALLPAELNSVDTFSCYIVHHKPLISLDGKSIATGLQAALETVQCAKSRVVHDHGCEFVNRGGQPEEIRDERARRIAAARTNRKAITSWI
jgi:hypothetical protein